jgi:hypothetical protein
VGTSNLNVVLVCDGLKFLLLLTQMGEVDVD